jgi:hypothetical protein
MKTISFLNIYYALTENGAQNVIIKKCTLGYHVQTTNISTQRLKQALSLNFKAHIYINDEGEGKFSISFN